MNEIYSKVTVTYIDENEQPRTFVVSNARCASSDGMWVVFTNTQAKAIPIERLVLIDAEGSF